MIITCDVTDVSVAVEVVDGLPDGQGLELPRRWLLLDPGEVFGGVELAQVDGDALLAALLVVLVHVLACKIVFLQCQ